MATTNNVEDNVDLDNARAELENDRLRLKRKLKFVKETDDLDTAIQRVPEDLLE